MLRRASGCVASTTVRQPAWQTARWKSSAADAPKKESEERTPLSVRLRNTTGAGRGVPIEQAKDPFSMFLANAKKDSVERHRRRNDARRMPPQMNRRSREPEPGQFSDAEPQQQPQSTSNDTRRNNYRQRSRNNGGDRQVQRRRSITQSQTVSPLSRATTFVDKDIDWTLMTQLESQPTIAAVTPAEEQEVVLHEMDPASIEGEYLHHIHWTPKTLGSGSNAHAVDTLLGGNAAYNQSQRSLFASVVANATVSMSSTSSSPSSS